jgi:hypothetical protein
MPGTGSDVGVAYVNLVASAKGLSSSISSEISGSSSGLVAAAGLAGDKAGGEMGSRLAKGAKLALAGGGLALIAGVLHTGMSEIQDASAGEAQLEAGIKSTGNAAGVSVPQLEALASSIQGFSGQTDDSIVAAEQLLLTFTNIKNSGPDKIFDQTTLAAANMAAKMGGDASTYAIQLGKALNDPVDGMTKLQRVGVTFTDEQKATVAALIKTGDTAGAQKVILAELTKEFGGAAEAAGKSLPGQIAIGKRSFEDLAQTAVGVLIPALLPIIQAVTGIIKFLTPLAPLLLPIAGIVLAIVAALKIWTIVQAALNIVMTANPIGIIIAAIAALVAIIIVAVKYHEQIRAAAVAAWGAISAAFSAAWGAIRSAFGAALGFVRGIPGKIVSALGYLGNLLLDAGKTVISGLWNGMKWLWNTYVAGWLLIGAKVKAAVGYLGDVLYDVGRSVINGFWAGLISIWSSVENWGKNLWHSITGWIHFSGGPLYEVGIKVMAGFADGLAANVGLARSVVTRTAESLAAGARDSLAIGDPHTASLAGGYGSMSGSSRAAQTPKGADLGPLLEELRLLRREVSDQNARLIWNKRLGWQ